MDRPQLAIVIPAFNEGATIARVVAGVSAYGRAIVVDDGSSDATAAEAEAAGALVVDHGGNRGYDAALSSGFERAASEGFKYVITFDADGQHDPALLGEYLKLLDSGAEVVVGIRPFKQRFSEKLFAAITSRLYRIDDPLCGMKGYRTEIYREAGFFDDYGSIGTALMLYAAKRGKKIAQLPIPIAEREGETRFGRVLRGNYLILRALIIGMARG